MAIPRLSARGDMRFYSLYCQVSSKKTRNTSAIGYGDGFRFCRKGALKIRTYGHRLRIQVTWRAAATATFAAYSRTRTYRT